jgi:hypothetical protein
MTDDITASNAETCQGCQRILPDGYCTCYITQTRPHYFYFLCDACEKATTVKAEG